jgi:hypothetical protein
LKNALIVAWSISNSAGSKNCSWKRKKIIALILFSPLVYLCLDGDEKRLAWEWPLFCLFCLFLFLFTGANNVTSQGKVRLSHIVWVAKQETSTTAGKLFS